MDDPVDAVLADLGDLLSGFVCETDADYIIKRAAGHFPHGSREAPATLVGRSLFDFAEDIVDLPARHAFSQKLKDREEVPRLNYRSTGPGGTVRHHELRARPLHHGGQFAGYRAIIRDTDEAREAEADLAAAQASSELAGRARTEFLSGISHELRTPLNAIIGFSEILHSEVLGPHVEARYREYAGDILVSARQLLGIINDLLDMSRLDGRKMDLRDEALDLCEIAGSCLAVFDTHFKSKSLTVAATLPPDLPNLWGDRYALRQMLFHLLSNAYKFTEPGGSITVSAARDASGTLQISVADTGIGIPPTHLNEVLVPFIHGETAFTRRYGGSGLGLPITKALVELHGGRLAIDSEENVGTTVTLIFPPERLQPPADSAQRAG